MKRFVCFILILALFPSLIARANGYENFERYIEKYMDEWGVNSYAAVIIKDQDEYFINKNSDIFTIFQAGSITKSLTYLLAEKLHDEEIINLDTPVNYYLPQTNYLFSVKDLLNHNSGFSPHLGDFALALGSIIPIEKLVQTTDTFSYTNIAYYLYEEIAKSKCGLDFDTLINTYVLSPLGMNFSNTSYEGYINSENKALPHFFGEDTGNFYENIYLFPSAAGLNTNIYDLSVYLKYLLSQPEFEGEMRVYERENESLEYAKGFYILKSQDYKIYYHTGTSLGMECVIAYDKEQNTGFALLSDSYPSPAYNIMRAFFEYEKSGVFPNITEPKREYGEIFFESESYDVSGTYHHDVYGEVIIEDNAIKILDNTFELTQIADKLYKIEFPKNLLYMFKKYSYILFQTNEDGKISGFSVEGINLEGYGGFVKID